jgi:beta-RFAP synthase
VTVTVPARLHLGFLDLSHGAARRFGGIGLAISAPETQITITRASQAEVVGPERARAANHVATMLAHLGLPGAHRVSIKKVVPAHAGLGSGTGIALAVAAGLRRLHDRPLDIEGDAGRGPDSASVSSRAAASSSMAAGAPRRTRRRSSAGCGFPTNGASSWCLTRPDRASMGRRR